MNSEKSFNWAIIGTGRIAKEIAREITKTNRHKIVAVFSRTQSKAKKFAEQFNATCCSSLVEAVLDKNVDAVYIATPHSSHYQIMKEIIPLKKPILCEKAFCVNLQQAEEVFRLAKEHNVYVIEGMWSYFNPTIRKIKEWIDAGLIGDITTLNASFCLPLTLSKPFVSDRVYKKEYAGGALLDLGIYPIAYSKLFLGYPDKIECSSFIYDDVDYDDKITLHYKNATAYLSCSFNKLMSYKGIICGTKGKIVSPMFYRPKSAKLYIDGKLVEKFYSASGYIHQFDGVAKEIREKNSCSNIVTPKDSLDFMKIMDICRAQNNFSYPDDIESL